MFKIQSSAILVPSFCATLLLAGCGSALNGGSPGASASGDVASATQAGVAPGIAGKPLLSVRIDEAYSFRPAVSVPAGATIIRFSIANKPSWATFDEATGILAGTPTLADVGTYHDILIGASTAAGAAYLPAFDLSVTQWATGAALVSWMPPGANTDGSALTDLSGFIIHFGRSADQLTRLVRIADDSISSFQIEDLTAGPWYFAVSAVNGAGVQSALSTIGYKSVE